MSCAQLSSWFKGKVKEREPIENLDYAHWLELYNSAKERKLLESSRKQRNEGINKFKSIELWLDEVGKDPDYVYTNIGPHFMREDDWIYINSIERPAHSKRLHSAKNSDYSYWSLDDSVDSGHFSDVDTQSEYCFQLRQQAHNLYVVI